MRHHHHTPQCRKQQQQTSPQTLSRNERRAPSHNDISPVHTGIGRDSIVGGGVVGNSAGGGFGDHATHAAVGHDSHGSRLPGFSYAPPQPWSLMPAAAPLSTRVQKVCTELGIPGTGALMQVVASAYNAMGITRGEGTLAMQVDKLEQELGIKVVPPSPSLSIAPPMFTPQGPLPQVPPPPGPPPASNLPPLMLPIPPTPPTPPTLPTLPMLPPSAQIQHQQGQPRLPRTEARDNRKLSAAEQKSVIFHIQPLGQRKKCIDHFAFILFGKLPGCTRGNACKYHHGEASLDEGRWRDFGNALRERMPRISFQMPLSDELVGKAVTMLLEWEIELQPLLDTDNGELERWTLKCLRTLANSGDQEAAAHPDVPSETEAFVEFRKCGVERLEQAVEAINLRHFDRAQRHLKQFGKLARAAGANAISSTFDQFFAPGNLFVGPLRPELWGSRCRQLQLMTREATQIERPDTPKPPDQPPFSLSFFSLGAGF